MSATNIFAQKVTFASEALSAAAKAVGLEQLDTLAQGTTLIEHNGYALVVGRNGNRIEHIGRKIFAKEMREANPSPVYDYLEYAYLDQTCKISENPFLYQSLVFVDGDWTTFSRVNDAVPFTITSENGKRYRVEWQMPASERLCLTFPIGYERLSMSSRRELELRFMEDLAAFDPSGLVSKPVEVDETKLEQVADDEWRLPGAHYMIKEINQDLYFGRDAAGQFRVIFDQEHPAESLVNLFTLGMIDKPDHGLVMKFKLYENKQQHEAVSIAQLLGYAAQRGCKVFWGIEGVSDEAVNATLMLVNESYGYNHIFGISCPRAMLFADKCVMTADVSLFVPTSNITNIFYQPEAKTKKIKWQ